MYALLCRACATAITLVSVLVVLTPLVAAPTARAATPTEYYVSTVGNDRHPGTRELPLRTLGVALQKLRPGDTLFVAGGTYVERIRDVPIHSGTTDVRVTVRNVEGERPVVMGLLWLRKPDYWTISGINVTWDPDNLDSTQHMVKLSGGTGWQFTNAELWGARSYAAVLVTGNATDWSLDHLFVHDTFRSNDRNQDHLIYVSNARNGVIERNLLVNSENGRGVKLARPSAGDGAPKFVTVRFNTFVHNLGANISTSYDAHSNEIYGNIMIDAGNYQNIAAHELSGGAPTVVYDNVGWQSRDGLVVEPDAGLADAGNNRSIDPGLDQTYAPTNPLLLDSNGIPLAGHLAGPVQSTALRDVET